MEGWIKIHRQITNWEWYTDSNVMRVFLHCLLKANYEETEWRNTRIERGQLLTSVHILSKELGLTTRQIRGTLDKLKMTNNLTIKTTNKYSIITVCKYDDYQVQEVDECQAERQTDCHSNDKQNVTQTTSNRATYKEDKNIRNKEVYIKESNTKVLPKKFSLKEKLISDGCSEELAEAYMRIRKAKHAPDSEIAYKGIIREISKAQITIQEAITECVERNWVGFKADWYSKSRPIGLRYEPEMEKELERRRNLLEEEREREIAEAKQRDIMRIENIIFDRP